MVPPFSLAKVEEDLQILVEEKDMVHQGADQGVLSFLSHQVDFPKVQKKLVDILLGDDGGVDLGEHLLPLHLQFRISFVKRVKLRTALDSVEDVADLGVYLILLFDECPTVGESSSWFFASTAEASFRKSSCDRTFYTASTTMVSRRSLSIDLALQLFSLIAARQR